MARNAVLARMETICVEVMEMPEIFLAGDDEDDDEVDDDALSENLNADEPVDDEDIPAADEENAGDEKGGDESERKEKGGSSGKSGGKSKRDKADAEQEKGVSVKVNCDDKKQQRYAKWISRALRAAVNPIVSRFNLNLKVNLDLNVANKANATSKADPPKSNSTESTSPASKPKASPRQLQRRTDLARIREKQSIIASYEEQLHKFKADIHELITSKTSSEAKFQQSVQEHLCSKNQLELRCLELMQQNRELNALVRRGVPSQENTTIQEPHSSSTRGDLTCPICGTPFKTLGDLQIHTENCGV
ncbi:hypothetical protein RP20_CCG026625 [Aedes albopictus]|nr:hypothetical protein RP20_CCG026625 [Aedes albopictus]